MNQDTIMSLLLAGGLIVFLIGFVMVMSVAFRRSAILGLVILILPVIYPLYALIKWAEPRARNGLLVSLVGIMVAFAAFYGGAGQRVDEVVELIPDEQLRARVADLTGQLPQASPTQDTLRNEAEAQRVERELGEDYDPLAKQEYIPVEEIVPLALEDEKQVDTVARPAVQWQYQRISKDLVPGFMGEKLRIRLADGQVKEGKLVKSTPTAMTLEFVVQQGTIALPTPYEEIAQIEVYARRGAAAAARRSAESRTGQSDSTAGDAPTGTARP
jgi:hypothetical protein